MREHSLRPIGTAVWAACASKLYICVFFLCVASLTSLRAQTLPLSHGERVDYDLYFKWGLIMSKAGLATLSVKESEYQGAPSWHYNLLFRSAGVIEKVFRMRDTMDCHYSKEPRLLFSSKRTNEGDYYLVDNLQFEYQGSGRIDIHSHRHTLKETKFRTRHFYIDIYDEAFSQAKEAAEVWIGDDENHIPVKIRAKLKIGAAEVYYKDSYNLRAPLTCRIVVQKK